MKKQKWIKLLGKLKYSKLEMLITKNGLFGLGRKQLLRFIGEIIEDLQAKTIKEVCERVRKFSIGEYDVSSIPHENTFKKYLNKKLDEIMEEAEK